MAVVAGSHLLGGCGSVFTRKTVIEPVRACGPASQYKPKIKAAFVRQNWK